jgi:hypothetical protein
VVADQIQMRGDNISIDNVRREASTVSGLEGRKYVKYKINDLETVRRKSMTDLYTGINEFQKCYQPRTNLVNYENGDLLADSHSILNRCRNFFCLLLNLHGINYVRHTEIHTTKPLVHELNSFEGETAIEKFKMSQDFDQSPAEFIQAGGNTK